MNHLLVKCRHVKELGTLRTVKGLVVIKMINVKKMLFGA